MLAGTEELTDELGQFYVVLLWVFVPGIITTVLLRAIHYVYYRIIKRQPCPDTKSLIYKRNYKWLYTFLIVSYLAVDYYRMVSALPPSYYGAIEVSYSEFSPRDLKSTFRKMSLKYHPDKHIGKEDEANAVFMNVRKAYEVLSDNTKRSLYDRFGPAAFECQHCKTVQEYMANAILSNMIYYVASFLFLVMFHGVGKDFSALFWRLLGLFCVFSIEVGILTGYSHHNWLFSSRPGFEKISLMHKLFLTLSIASNMVLPYWFLKPSSQSTEALVSEAEKKMVSLYAEVYQNMKLMAEPFAKSEVMTKKYQKVMDKATIEGQLSTYPECQDAHRRVSERLKKLI
ncbi:hypothetical protein MP638_005799 [Amoeboaphelidium occidentale]|nr:hypothetical protein MP638_005799 [Amoeboaphelidium occidentale]